MENVVDSATDEALGRSWYRVKIAILCAVFLGCWIGLKLHVTRHPEFLFALAAVAAVPVNFVRCERCHSSLYYRKDILAVRQLDAA